MQDCQAHVEAVSSSLKAFAEGAVANATAAKDEASACLREAERLTAAVARAREEVTHVEEVCKADWTELRIVFQTS